MSFLLIKTKKFTKAFRKLPEDIILRFEKQFVKICENPYHYGDQIKGRDWFRELKNLKYRVYFLIFVKKIILVGVSDKNNQQEVINYLLREFNIVKTQIIMYFSKMDEEIKQLKIKRNKPLEITLFDNLYGSVFAVGVVSNQTYDLELDDFSVSNLNATFLFIESSYPSGVHSTNLVVNSSEYSDSVSGVIVNE